MTPRKSHATATAVRKELTEAGRLDTALGRSALVLAAMVDDLETPGTARVAAAKELRTTLAEATKSATVASDPVDELKARRTARLAGNA